MKLNSLSKKLFVGFFSIIILLVMIGGMGFYSVKEMNDEYSHLLDDRVKRVDLVDELISINKNISTNVYSYLLLKEQRYINEIVTENEKFMEIYEELKRILSHEQDLELLEQMLVGKEEYLGMVNNITDSFIKREPGQVEKNVRIASSTLVLFLSDAERLKEIQSLEMNKTRDNLNKLANTTYLMIIVFSIVAMIVSGLIAYIISRNITRPVQVMTNALEQVADGNLQIGKLSIKNRDEIGVMATAFNKMTDDLRVVVSSMNDSAIQLAAQSEELSASSEESTAASIMVASAAEENLKGSEVQLEIVETTVSSMEKMTAEMRQIATSNEDMLQSAQLVGSLVEQGALAFENVSVQMNEIRSTIQETANTMEVLEQNSSKIQNVTALITAISDQTNLLALNAAIEAARAGEHGKGFAVVAEEVRKLAEQSKNSAFEIEGMVELIQSDATKASSSIKTGSDKVNLGLATVETSLEIFEEIEKATQDSTDSVKIVSTAINEIQTKTNEVVNGSVQVRKLAEKAATSARESSASTDEQLATMQEISASIYSLASFAEDLQMEVSKFKV